MSSEIEEKWAREAAAHARGERAKSDGSKKPYIALGVFALVFVGIAVGFSIEDGTFGCREEDPVDDCTQRGVAYFKEIGSYPRLSTGEYAETEAFQRCSRTTTAFP